MLEHAAEAGSDLPPASEVVEQVGQQPVCLQGSTTCTYTGALPLRVATKRRTHRARVLCKPKRLLQCCVPWAHPLHAGMQVRRNLSEVVEAATKTPDQARDSRPAIGQEGGGRQTCASVQPVAGRAVQVVAQSLSLLCDGTLWRNASRVCASAGCVCARWGRAPARGWPAGVRTVGTL